MPTARMPALALLWLLLGALAGCGAGAGHGHWADPGVRLVDGIWIGPQVACPPAPGECETIASGARKALPAADRSRVAQIAWVSLPTHFVTDGGEQRTPRLGVGLSTWVAAMVTLEDGSTRVVGLGCTFLSTGGVFDYINSGCGPGELRDWRDGGVPPSYPPGTIFG